MNTLQKIGLNQISSTGNSKQNSRIEAVGGLPLKAKAWKNIPPNAKTAISVSFRPFGGFRGKIAVLRHLEGFFEKSEENRPPLKLKNNGGLLSIVFL